MHLTKSRLQLLTRENTTICAARQKPNFFRRYEGMQNFLKTRRITKKFKIQWTNDKGEDLGVHGWEKFAEDSEKQWRQKSKQWK